MISPCFVSCGDATIGATHDPEDLHRAWLVTEAIANWYTLTLEMKDSFQNAFLQLVMNKDLTATMLSNVDEAVATTKEHIRVKKMVTSMLQALISGFTIIATGGLKGPESAAIVGVQVIASNLVSTALNAEWDYTNTQVDTWVPGLKDKFGVEVTAAFSSMMKSLIDDTVETLRDPGSLALSGHRLDKILNGGSFAVKNLDLSAQRQKATTYITV